MSGKIVIIGAGSIVFSRGLISDIILNEKLRGFTVGLCDIDEEALELISALAHRMAEHSNSEIEIESSTERRDLLPGANFVIQTIAIGGKEAWEKDIEIPLKHGVLQTVGDTMGPGGISRALRVIPHTLAICRDMEELCPEAWLINYSNPLTPVCMAAIKGSRIKTIGLCHGLRGTQGALAQFLSVPVERTSVFAAGINHFNWILRFMVNGDNGFDMLREKIRSEGTPDWMRVTFELFEIYDAIPVPGDRHIVEFLPHYLTSGDMIRRYGFTPMKPYGQSREYWEEVRRDAESEPFPLDKYLRPSGEEAIEIIASMVEGSPRLFDAVNLPNAGLIGNLPEIGVVEVPAVVGWFGVKGVSVGEIPEGIASLIAPRIYEQELIAEAAAKRSYKLALQAMMADPLVPTPQAARRILDELLEAHGDLIPI
ncbi:alpha-glucosidase/alpha-galactosidase [Candidatus Poribacteria bacterium]|nr:alpha-glucosidase/alpha-galactosidase [Candidatus Poribacteria bacterium]